jgi:hypothetical protein
MANDLEKAKAKTQAMRAWQAEDGRKAMAEYEANIVATREKTERLRALRMAREAAEAKAPPAAPAKPKSKTKAAKKPVRVAGKFSDRLEDQRDGGANA